MEAEPPDMRYQALPGNEYNHLGLLYQLKNGCNWEDLPPYSTVYWHYKQWRSAGVIEKLMSTLHEQVREQVKKKPKWTALIIIGSQAVKNTCNASLDSKG
jgi:transposase